MPHLRQVLFYVVVAVLLVPVMLYFCEYLHLRSTHILVRHDDNAIFQDGGPGFSDNELLFFPLTTLEQALRNLPHPHG